MGGSLTEGGVDAEKEFYPIAKKSFKSPVDDLSLPQTPIFERHSANIPSQHKVRLSILKGVNPGV